MQNINLSLKYLDRVIQDIYLDLNLLSAMPANEHTKSVINHTIDRVKLLENFLFLLNEFYENELNIVGNKEDEDNKIKMADYEKCEL